MHSLTVIRPTKHKISPVQILVVEINARRKTFVSANSFRSVLFGEFMGLECKGFACAQHISSGERGAGWGGGVGGGGFSSDLFPITGRAYAAWPLIRIRTL